MGKITIFFFSNKCKWRNVENGILMQVRLEPSTGHPTLGEVEGEHTVTDKVLSRKGREGVPGWGALEHQFAQNVGYAGDWEGKRKKTTGLLFVLQLGDQNVFLDGSKTLPVITLKASISRRPPQFPAPRNLSRKKGWHPHQRILLSELSAQITNDMFHICYPDTSAITFIQTNIPACSCKSQSHDPTTHDVACAHALSSW